MSARLNRYLGGLLICIMPTVLNACHETNGTTDHTVTLQECMSVDADVAEIIGCNDLFCPPGTRRCKGNSIQECVGSSMEESVWIDIDTCQIACQNATCTQTLPDPQADCEFGTKRCSGNLLQTCQMDINNNTLWVTQATCPDGCDPNALSCIDPSQPQITCTANTRRCLGKHLQSCQTGVNGSTSWVTDKTCDAFCVPDKWICSETLPQCKLKNNSKATILQWTDGDTLWVRAVSDGTCNDYEYVQSQSKWMKLRYDLRIHGIDAPECAKRQNQYGYYTCVQNANYTNTNERFGYESWAEAVKLLPYEYEVTLTCDETEYDGTCVFDRTDSRYLVYMGYARNNASYDFSVELARQGLAFSNTKFASSKRKEICTAQKEAIQAKRNIWSLGNTVSEVLSKMSTTKQTGLKKMESLCNTAMK